MSFLEICREGPVVLITLNRPEQRNALSGGGCVQEIIEICDEINRDLSIRCAILTGAGTAFSAGGDIKAMKSELDEGLPAPHLIRESFDKGIQRLTRALYFLEVPVIAAVNGPAMGAGLDLACMCDIRIASQGARFAESFVRLGLVAGDGGAWLLPRLIGRAAASQLAFTGTAIDSAAALRLGLVQEVVEPEGLLPRALELAREIAANSGPALRMTKHLIRESDQAGLNEVLAASAAAQALARHTEEHGAAVEAAVRALSKPAS